MTSARPIPRIALRVILREDPLNLDARVTSGAWSGATGIYIKPDRLLDRARHLLAWSERPQDEFRFEAGNNLAGFGWLCLRLNPLPGNLIGCHVRIALCDTGDRVEDVWRLSLEIPTGSQLVALFAQQLISMAEGSTGDAQLDGIDLLCAHPDRPLPPDLVDEVRAQRQPDELVWHWSTENSPDSAVTVLMIPEAIFREHKFCVKAFAGLMAGGGRSLHFAKGTAGWEFTGESEWIS